jgi:hypothetical protein
MLAKNKRHVGSSVKYLVFLCFLPLIYACVSLYDPELKSGVQRLVVESHLTTQNQFQYVYLTYDSGYNSEETNFKFLVRKAKVSVQDDQGKVYQFFDEIPPSDQIKTPEGYNYRSVDKFKVEFGRKYTLKIETIDGRKYESSQEMALPVPKITKTYSEFKIAPPPRSVAGNFTVFIDTKDAAESANFYMWRAKHVKQINYCREWYIFGQGGGTTQAFVDRCCQPCYETQVCRDCYEVANDRLINGNTLSKQYVATVPFSETKPYYLVISQFSLNENAYKYWNALKKQSKNSGGLFDATPQSLQSNIKNSINPQEQVLGYFTVSDVQDEIVIIDRNLASPKPILIEEYSTFTKTTVCYPCEESYNRTKTVPTGWRF